MKRFLKRLVLTLIVILLTGFLFVKYQLRDRHPDYKLYQKINTQQEGQIQAGFAAVSITPEIIDTWNDVDGNAKYEPKKGDSFNDNNHNGKFDVYWIAGFHNRRAANGVHDSLWARTVVFDDGTSRIAMISLDAIGFFHDDVIKIREKIPHDLGIDYCMVSSNHDHEAPDLLGIWGKSPFKNGINREYRQMVIDNAVLSLKKAVADLESVTLYFARDENSAQKLIKDTRLPQVFDPGIRLIHAKKEDGTTKGVLVTWANHPETLWSKNLLLTSDFPHFFRQGMEEKLGGTCVYFNGAVGGLMTTHPSLEIIHPLTGEKLSEGSFKKAEAEGMILTEIAVKALQNPLDSIKSGKIKLEAKTFAIPFDNSMFRLAAVIGVLDRGMSGWWKMRTEIAAWSLGPASFLTIPGEIYPEIVNGGVEAPGGQDFEIEPVETPPLRSMMPGKFKFIIGLANDEIGYIIPKSEWDNKKPWIYNPEKDSYGEENSMGPETAPLIYKTATEILSGLN